MIGVTDRRSSLRFEIVGRLRGSLATAQPVRLHDVSPSGALVEISFPLSVNSRQVVQFAHRGHVSTLDARVRHVRPAIDRGRYLVGLEFLSPQAQVDEALGLGVDPERA